MTELVTSSVKAVLNVILPVRVVNAWMRSNSLRSNPLFSSTMSIFPSPRRSTSRLMSTDFPTTNVRIFSSSEDCSDIVSPATYLQRNFTGSPIEANISNTQSPTPVPSPTTMKFENILNCSLIFRKYCPCMFHDPFHSIGTSPDLRRVSFPSQQW